MRRFGSFLALVGGLSLAVAAVTPRCPRASQWDHRSGDPRGGPDGGHGEVEVTLLDHIGELLHVERSYDMPIGTGTGTVVNPEGAMVTLTRVVKNDLDLEVLRRQPDLRRAPQGQDPADFERHTLKDERLNHHLQECYPPKRPTATCIFDVTTDLRVFPNMPLPTRRGSRPRSSARVTNLTAPPC